MLPDATLLYPGIVFIHGGAPAPAPFFAPTLGGISFAVASKAALRNDSIAKGEKGSPGRWFIDRDLPAKGQSSLLHGQLSARCKYN
jgi:hypothetical protein